MAEQTVTLQPSESTPVSFEAIPREAKLYHVSVNGLTGSFWAVALPLAGRIIQVVIWYEGLAGWEGVTSGREIPLNQEIILAVGWLNDSEVNIFGHVDLEITYPDGTRETLSATYGQDTEGSLGSGDVVKFQPFVSTQEGTYTLTATLSSAGQVLDSVPFTLVTLLMECTPGAAECREADLYVCSSQGRWELAEANSPQCIIPPLEKILEEIEAGTWTATGDQLDAIADWPTEDYQAAIDASYAHATGEAAEGEVVWWSSERGYYTAPPEPWEEFPPWEDVPWENWVDWLAAPWDEAPPWDNY